MADLDGFPPSVPAQAAAVDPFVLVLDPVGGAASFHASIVGEDVDALGGGGAGIVAQGCDERGKPSRADHGVVVDGGQQLAAGGGKPAVGATRKAQVAL